MKVFKIIIQVVEIVLPIVKELYETIKKEKTDQNNGKI